MPPGSFTLAPAMHTSRAFTTEPTMHQVGGVVEAPVVAAYQLGKPVRAMGDLFAMGLDGMVLTFKPPFAWREYLLQTWFVARVSMLPALMMTLPYSVILTFIFNILLTEIGAGDLSGTGAAIGTVNQIAPIVTVLVVSGAGATAMCADLGARTIREELDAMRVLGINPIQRLVVPRVLAATTVALALEAAVTVVGLAGAFFFTVYVQHVSAGAFVTGLTTLTGLSDVLVSLIKATLFGYAAGMIACYKGISVGGGPAGVGNAVNETVVFTFMVLFAINVIVTAVGIQFTVS
jgi:phospholipid/cholesterol/gamma-HCH transport system permease protein